MHLKYISSKVLLHKKSDENRPEFQNDLAKFQTNGPCRARGYEKARKEVGDKELKHFCKHK